MEEVYEDARDWPAEMKELRKKLEQQQKEIESIKSQAKKGGSDEEMFEDARDWPSEVNWLEKLEEKLKTWLERNEIME